MTACRSCSAPILWAESRAGGRAMPLDAEPTEEGNVAWDGVSCSSKGSPIVDVRAEPGRQLFDPAGLILYRPHFASCPDADDWRKR